VDSRVQRLKGVLSSPQFHSHPDLNHIIGKSGVVAGGGGGNAGNLSLPWFLG